jgi:hypothetical protein
MRLLRSLAAIAAVVLVAAACGGANPSSGTPGASPSSSGAGGPSVLPVPVSSELGVGVNRMVFGFIDAATNRPVGDPGRTVSAEFTGPGGETIEPIELDFVWAIEDERGVYVGEVDFPTAGEWTALFETAAASSAPERLRFTFDVREDTSVLRPGEAAPSVDTPTADDVGGDLARLSTDTEPVPAFYETSVADALAAGEPFVLAFATPKFCATAQCGPTLDRLKPIAEAHPEITFINVEPYELEFADGQLQPVTEGDPAQLKAVPAVREFGLLSEPYIFVVDGSGTITASFEAIFAEEEIEAALAALD